MPEKEAKRAFRNRPKGIPSGEPLRCLPTRLPKKTAHTNLPHMLAVFLTHASPPSRNAADSELIISALIGSHRNRWVRGAEGFNRRVSISVLRFKSPDLRPLGAPKLSACAAGIESVCYDFDRFLCYFLSRKENKIMRQHSTGPTNEPPSVLSKVRHCRFRGANRGGRYKYEIIEKAEWR